MCLKCYIALEYVLHSDQCIGVFPIYSLGILGSEYQNSKHKSTNFEVFTLQYSLLKPNVCMAISIPINILCTSPFPPKSKLYTSFNEYVW